jgi:hypothetical protein
LNCADILDGKRRNSLFCCTKCQRRFRRSRHNTTQEDQPRHEPIVCLMAGTVDAGECANLQV